MDIATVVGFIAAVTCLMVGIGPHLPAVVDPTVIVIVVGGTLATTLIANPLQDVVNLVGIYLRTVFIRLSVPTELVERMVGFAETARREGILALEHAIERRDDPFLSQGVRLAVDGTEPALIMDILETELAFIEERHTRAQRVVGSLGVGGAVFGGLGATLAVVLQARMGASGTGLAAAAALPLAYGLLVLGVLAEPFRRKLRAYHDDESLTKRMIIEGIMSIQSGDNPRIVEHKLSVFLAPKLRPSAEAPTAVPARVAPPSVDEAFVAEVRDYGTAQEERLAAAVREAAAGDDVPPEERERTLALLAKLDHGELPAITVLASLSDELRAAVVRMMEMPVPARVAPETAVRPLSFEDLAKLTDREIQVLLREVDQKDLLVSLIGASQELRDRLLGNMSERVRTFLQEEMGYLGPLRASEVFAVQTRIVAQVLDLIGRGQITAPR